MVGHGGGVRGVRYKHMPTVSGVVSVYGAAVLPLGILEPARGSGRDDN